MNSFANKIEKSIRKNKSVSGKKVFEDIVFGLVKKTSMGLSDICNAPTPLVLNIHNNLSEYYEKKNKASKKR